MPIASGINHIATLTTDMARTVGFYEQVFEAVVTHEVPRTEDHPWMKVVDLGGGAALNVFEVAEEEMIGDRRRIGGRGNIDHFGIAVPDLPTLEKVRDRLTAAGADIGEIQNLGGDTWSLFFRDVDGLELEVSAPA